jgi:Threonine dehydrogenase and related Zn-dependent dehydrogenases
MVAIYPGVFCGECVPCRMGYTARCEKGRIYGFNEDGLFRSIIPFSERQLSSLIPIPQDVNQELAALAEPLACCLSAVRMFEHAKKESALIIGAGFVGSLFAALLKTQGWRKIIVADKNRERLSKELPQGVKVMDTSISTLAGSLRNEEIDLIVPACPNGLDWPFWKVMKKGGCVSSFSGNQEGKELLPVDMNAVHYKELTLAGSYGCNIEDFRSALNMLVQGEIGLSFLIFTGYPSRKFRMEWRS